MKRSITTAAIALILAAGVSHAALAQGRGGEGRGGEGRHGGDHGQRGGGGQDGGGQGGQGDQGWQGRGGEGRGGQGRGGEGRGFGQAAPQAQAAPEAPQAAAAPAPRQERASRATLAEDFRRQRDDGRGGAPRIEQPRIEQPRAQQPRADQGRGGQSFDRNRAGDRSDGDRNRQADGARQGDNRGGWDGRRYGDRGGDHQRWEQGRYPPIYRSQQRFRIGNYRAPSGYYFRQWAFGDFLPFAWFGSDYLLSDFDYYGLPYPPPGYEWVRVGQDALLVDQFTGEVVQVVRYLFW